MISAKIFQKYIVFTRSLTLRQLIEERLRKNANVLYIILYTLLISPPENLFEY